MITKITSGIAYCLNAPIQTYLTPESSRLAKIVSGVAIAIFTALSLSIYGVYAYRCYQNEKAWQALESVLDRTLSEDAPTSKENEDIALRTVDTCSEAMTPSAFRNKLYNLDDRHLYIHKALNKKYFKLTLALIEKGANLHCQSRIGTPLTYAINKKNYDAVEWLYNENLLCLDVIDHVEIWKSFFNMPNKDKQKTENIRNNQINILRLLLQAGLTDSPEGLIRIETFFKTEIDQLSEWLRKGEACPKELHDFKNLLMQLKVANFTIAKDLSDQTFQNWYNGLESNENIPYWRERKKLAIESRALRGPRFPHLQPSCSHP